MFVAKVVGNVWATRKHPSLSSKKMLLVKPVDELSGLKNGDVQLALDVSMGAGAGDMVLVLDEGSSCRQMLGMTRGPIRTIILGVIDCVSKNGKTEKYH